MNETGARTSLTGISELAAALKPSFAKRNATGKLKGKK
jgi:hypothetical protein